MANTNAANKYKAILLESFGNGNKKALASSNVDAMFSVPVGTYKLTLNHLQTALHEYVQAHAMDNNEKMQAAKSAFFDLLRSFVDNLPGIMCDAGNLTFLMMACYRLVKQRDEMDEVGKVVSVGNRQMKPVSDTAFQIAVETMLAHMLLGREWCDMKGWVEMSHEKAAKIQARIEKRNSAATAKAAKEDSKAKKQEDAKATLPKQTAKDVNSPSKPEQAPSKNEKAPAIHKQSVKKETPLPTTMVQEQNVLPTLDKTSVVPVVAAPAA